MSAVEVTGGGTGGGGVVAAADADSSDTDNASAALIYEVNLDLDAAIADDYLIWLREHIAHLCTLPGFLGARLHTVSDPAAEAGRVALSVHYRLRDQAALDDYLREHAPRMRADGISRFGGRFNASRRVLQPLAR